MAIGSGVFKLLGKGGQPLIFQRPPLVKTLFRQIVHVIYQTRLKIVEGKIDTAWRQIRTVFAQIFRKDRIIFRKQCQYLGVFRIKTVFKVGSVKSSGTVKELLL